MTRHVLARAPAPLVPLVLLVLLAGCGSDTAGTAPAPTPGGGGGSGAAAPRTELTVTVVADQDAAATTWTLTCDPAGGTHPDPAAACRALTGVVEPFAPLPSDVACTEIYGGPQTARITGRHAGREVAASYDRSNGCEISRWDAIAPVLGPIRRERGY